MTFVSFGQG